MEAKKTFLKISLVLGLALVAVSFWGNKETSETPLPVVNEEQEDTSTSVGTAESRERTEVKQFSAEEFKLAYDNLSLPNITPIVQAQEVTGNLEADTQIAKLAEARGYQLRDVASGLLNEIDGKPVQELLIGSWSDLQQMALEEGVNIEFVSGYRSIEDQRDIFLDRLLTAGGSADSIAAGGQTDLVDNILAVTAPPGYSRHHSGYTIDVEDPGFAVFANSTAYAWISANNFEKAKLHGFIPSYPNGLTNQGPNPEPWEFVWVGPTVTYE